VQHIPETFIEHYYETDAILVNSIVTFGLWRRLATEVTAGLFVEWCNLKMIKGRIETMQHYLATEVGFSITYITNI
jgi:hypothetical protein